MAMRFAATPSASEGQRNDMIAVKLNEDRYSYEIHSLVQAFYPGTEVKVAAQGGKEWESDAGLPAFFVCFESGRVRVGVQAPSDTAPWWREASLEAGDGRVEIKNKLKRLLYGALSAVTGKQLPWGALTGIRPVGLAMRFLERGLDEEAACAQMQVQYLVSPRKAALAVEIAGREREILKDFPAETGFSLYVGIPFCPTTCLYCSFPSYPIAAWRDRVGEYFSALEKEIDFAARAGENRRLDSVYIGGGTPTSLSCGQLEWLLGKLRGSFDWADVREFTVEAGRPDSISREKLDVLRSFGVGRISINPQTMNQKTLDAIGRRHTVGQVEEAFRTAREAGFDNINMDLILGLPGEGEREVEETFCRVTALSPDSLTVHSLAVKRGSRLAAWTAENGVGCLQNTEGTMRISEEAARGMGLAPYYLYRQKNMSGNFENVGYSLPGKEGIYNILIMEDRQSILALGAGTVSKAVFPDGRIQRCDCVKDLEQYLERVDEMVERKRRLFALTQQSFRNGE